MLKKKNKNVEPLNGAKVEKLKHGSLDFLNILIIMKFQLKVKILTIILYILYVTAKSEQKVLCSLNILYRSACLVIRMLATSEKVPIRIPVKACIPALINVFMKWYG